MTPASRSGVSLEIPLPEGGRRRLEASGPGELAELAGSSEVSGEGRRELFLGRLEASGGLSGCLSCGHPELFRRKDFPQALGFAVLALAAVAAPFTHYLSLVAAALLDALLYVLRPDVVVCYQCGARHRGFGNRPRHPRFDIEIAERLRFGEKAVMGKPMRPGGTADAPDPEH